MALASAIVVACAAQAGPALFHGAGHTGELARMEIVFFSDRLLGRLSGIADQHALGLFTATERTRNLMVVQVVGRTGLRPARRGLGAGIGHYGFPRMGIAGAALAMISAQSVSALLLVWLFFRAREQRDYGIWSERRLDWALLLAIAALPVDRAVCGWRWKSFPGLCLCFSSGGWEPPTGGHEHSLANQRRLVFPADRFGTSGERLRWSMPGPWTARFVSAHRLSRSGNERGLDADLWRGICFFARPLVRMFFDAGSMSQAEQTSLFSLSVVMLRFVAAYSVLDACNVIVLSALQAAGTPVGPCCPIWLPIAYSSVRWSCWIAWAPEFWRSGG